MATPQRFSHFPAVLSSFVGREHDLAQIGVALEQCRLLTLTGPGGVGKTRLALQAAQMHRAHYAGSCVFVDLAVQHNPHMVLASIAQALQISDSDPACLITAITERCAGEPLLLLLDNCEHVAGAAPDLAALLAATSNLRILATSRVPLRIAGEREYPVEPLPISAVGETASAALQLFLERARAVRPDLLLDGETLASCQAICERLDGLPLAIELAAARLRALPPAALLARLAKRLPLLSGGPRDLPARQRALRDTIAWSVDLLKPAEQQLFRRLAVFAGNWSLEALAAVAGIDELAALDQLTTLIEHNLIQANLNEEEAPYSMLDTVREYAAELLAADTEELFAAHGAHAAFYHSLAVEASRHLFGSDQHRWFLRLESELGNIRTALEWLIGQGPIEDALHIGATLWQFWRIRGHVREGRDWLEQAIAVARQLPGADEHFLRHFAAGLRVAGVLALLQMDCDVTRAYLEESLAFFRRLADQQGIADTLNNLGQLACDLDDIDAAEGYYIESKAIQLQIGNQQGLARAINNLGYIAEKRGDYQMAHEHYLRASKMAREAGNVQLSLFALSNAGEVLIHEQRYAESRRLISAALAEAAEIGATGMVIETLQHSAELAAAEGRAAYAVSIFAMIETWRKRAGTSLSFDEYPRVVNAIKRAHEQLGPEHFAAAWMRGQQFELAAAIDFALHDGNTVELPSAPATALPAAAELPLLPATTLPPLEEPLTPREADVLALLASGQTNRQIADTLIMSVHTVNSHVKAIFGKLGVSSRAAATRAALERGLVTKGYQG